MNIIDLNILEIKQSNLPQMKEVEWQRIDWKKVEKTVFNLQKRIYQATIKGDEKRAQNLIKLLLRSHSNVLKNIRRVTQDNSGKKNGSN
jgi:DNA-binding FadR family transcriptional regulator